MTPYTFFHDRRYRSYYVVAAIFFFAVGAYISFGAAGRKGNAISIEKENGRLRSLMNAPAKESHLPFLHRLFQKDDAESYAELLELSGLSISDISEKEIEGNGLGNFNQITLQGKGTFLQIIRGFDIIQSKERWNTSDLVELSRRGEDLLFTMRVTTFQSRGTYEEEKYRAHRPHGDRKEPGR